MKKKPLFANYSPKDLAELTAIKSLYESGTVKSRNKFIRKHRSHLVRGVYFTAGVFNKKESAMFDFASDFVGEFAQVSKNGQIFFIDRDFIPVICPNKVRTFDDLHMLIEENPRGVCKYIKPVQICSFLDEAHFSTISPVLEENERNITIKKVKDVSKFIHKYKILKQPKDKHNEQVEKIIPIFEEDIKTSTMEKLEEVQDFLEENNISNNLIEKIM